MLGEGGSGLLEGAGQAGRKSVLRNGPYPSGPPPSKAARVDGLPDVVGMEGVSSESLFNNPLAQSLFPDAGSIPVGSSASAQAGLGGMAAVPETGGGSEDGKESGDEEPSMKDLMKQMKKMSSNLGGRFELLSENLGGRFDLLQKQLSDFRAELQNLKNDMVTNQVFASLEERVAALEIGGIGNSEVTFLKK